MTKSDRNRLLRQVPVDAQATFRRLLSSTLQGGAELSANVHRYRTTITKAATRNEFIDITLAYAIADRLTLLLDRYEDLPPDHQSVVSAAVAYFVLPQDAEDDLDSVLGFEDDAMVLNACLDYIGAPDLKIPIE